MKQDTRNVFVHKETKNLDLDEHKAKILKEADYVYLESRCEYNDNRIKDLLETIEGKKLTIKCLNDCLGGEGSCTTDNMVTLARYEDRIAQLEDENKTQLKLLTLYLERDLLMKEQIDKLKEQNEKMKVVLENTKMLCETYHIDNIDIAIRQMNRFLKEC